ncbi:MAG: HAMP domain-containing protein, partial [Anaerolineales bacterium]
MITTILTSAHVLVTLILFVSAALALFADPRSSKHRAISALLMLYGFASIAFGMELNAISVSNAQPWIILELVTVYGSAPAAFLVAVTILRPQVANKLYISIPAWFFILLPALLVLLDISNASQMFFSTNLLINFDELRTVYTGGYIGLTQTTTGIGIFILLTQLIFFYMVTIIYPTLVVIIRDRKSDQQNYRNALILFIAVSLGTIVSSVFRDSLVPTIAPMLTNIFISAGFFIVAMRLTASASKTNRGWLNQILKKYPMFSKLLGTMAIIIIPTMVFIAFTSYSFFQNSILSLTYNNLGDVASREVQILLNNLADDIHTFQHLDESSRIRTQLNNRSSSYEGNTVDQIRQLINFRQQQWEAGDPLVISTTLDPVNNTEFRTFINNNPDFTDIVLVDGYGALVTTIENPYNYDFSETAWWQHIAVSQSVYIGPIVWDNTLQQYTTEIAVPMFNANGEALLGGLKTTYILTSLFSRIEQNTQGQVNFGFITPSGLIIPTSNNQAEEFSLPENYLSALAEAQDWQTYDLAETSYLMNSKSVSSAEADYDTSWTLLAYQPVTQALGSLFTVQLAIFISAILILSAAVFIIIWLSQSITQPLTILTEAASKSIIGQSDVMVELDSDDEIGTLANTFNAMTQELNLLVENLEQTIDTRTSDLERRA